MAKRIRKKAVPVFEHGSCQEFSELALTAERDLPAAIDLLAGIAAIVRVQHGHQVARG